jgi:outer membrane lipoprotein SlyB
MQTPQAQALQAGFGGMAVRNPITDALGIQGVQVPTADQYVNPQAGAQAAQFGLSNYQNQLAANSLNQSNPWMGALSGAASGAAAGTTISPGYGTAIGAVGGALQGYFSDERLKRNITRAGTSRDGIPIVEFQYKGFDKRFKGVIAQDVMKVRPDAVFEHGGYLGVYYDRIGVKYEEV